MRLKGPIFAGLLATLIAAGLVFWFLSPLGTITGAYSAKLDKIATKQTVVEPPVLQAPSLQEPDPTAETAPQSVQEMLARTPAQPEAPDPIDSFFKIVDRLIASAAGILGLILTVLKIRDMLLEKKKQVVQAAPTPSA